MNIKLPCLGQMSLVEKPLLLNEKSENQKENIESKTNI